MNTTSTVQAPARARQRGMSLIELMVGVVVGLIGCVVIFQVYQAAEARKRSVAMGSDMDISGRLGLMTLERDLQLAGYGLGAAASLDHIETIYGCNVAAYDNQRPAATQTFSFPLVPVLIQDGAAGAPDTVTTLRGSSSFAVTPKIIDGSSTTTKRIKKETGGRTGVMNGDVVIATRFDAGVPICAMFQITSDANKDDLTFDHVGGRYNKADGLNFTLPDEGNLVSLGPVPVRNIWSVANSKLVSANDIVSAAAPPIEAADLIIDLQAQYGYDADGDGIISPGEWITTLPVPADWRQLIAVRFALLARSTQYEKEKVTKIAPRWSAGEFVMKDINAATDSDPGGAEGGVNNWRNYRYNVFETVVPVRNQLIGRQLS